MTLAERKKPDACKVEMARGLVDPLDCAWPDCDCGYEPERHDNAACRALQVLSKAGQADGGGE